MKRTTLLVRVGVSVLALLALVVGKGGGMKRHVLSVAVVGMTLALAAGMALAQATTDTFNDRFSFAGEDINPCTGELFHFEGTDYAVVHRTADAGGGFHFKVQQTIQVQGEGLSSGDKYILNDTFNFHRNSSTGADLNFTFTATGTSKIIRQGSDTTTEESNSRFVLHVTVNANGELTTDFLKFEETCVGT